MGRTRTTRLIGTGLSLLLITLASCGDGGGAEDPQGDNLESVRVAYATSIGPHDVPLFGGPLDYGDDFGLSVEESDLAQLESHATAMQSMLGGQFEVVGGSFLSDLLVIEEGQDIRVFCPGASIFDASFVGIGDVTSFEQLTDPEVRIGVDSEGGAVNYFMNLLFRELGLDFRVEDFQNVVVLEDTSLRTNALIAGDIDAAMIAQFEVPLVIEALGEENVNILSRVPDDVSRGIFFPFAATTEWLDGNPEEAAAFCASVLKATREYAADFETFRQAVNNHVGGGEDLSDEDIRGTWEIAEQLWATDNTLTEENVRESIAVAVEMGLVSEGLTYEEVIDPRPVQEAVRMLGDAE